MGRVTADLGRPSESVASERRQPFLISAHFIFSRECVQALKQRRAPSSTRKRKHFGTTLPKEKKNPTSCFKKTENQVMENQRELYVGSSGRGEMGSSPGLGSPHGHLSGGTRLESPADGSGEQAGTKSE